MFAGRKMGFIDGIGYLALYAVVLEVPTVRSLPFFTKTTRMTEEQQSISFVFLRVIIGDALVLGRVW